MTSRSRSVASGAHPVGLRPRRVITPTNQDGGLPADNQLERTSNSCMILVSKTIAKSWCAAQTGRRSSAAVAGRWQSAKRQRVVSSSGALLGSIDVSRCVLGVFLQRLFVMPVPWVEQYLGRRRSFVGSVVARRGLVRSAVCGFPTDGCRQDSWTESRKASKSIQRVRQ